MVIYTHDHEDFKVKKMFDGDNIDAENIRTFIEDYDEERLERKELQEDEEEADDAARSYEEMAARPLGLTDANQ